MHLSSNAFLKTCAVALTLTLAGLALPALANDGGGGGGGGGSSSNAPIECRKGMVYDENKKICVPSHALNDQQLYQQGHDLAVAGRYDSALDALNAIRNKNDAMVLTMIGYSKRKLGALDEGIAIYHQALAIDPNNINTREYLGEGYIDAGRVDLAEAELDKLQVLCGKECEQYQDLQKAVAGSAKWN
jgi:tetratricopeptide (TPR) repeat protein